MLRLTINGKSQEIDVEPDTPLLWVIRDTIGMTGTKYGCGIAQCGACTVHIDSVATRACAVSVGDVAGKKVTTIEGLAENGVLTKVQQAWVDLDVPQCGYCQSGFDPLEFRRRLMANHPKHLGVLNAVADGIGWSKPAPAGVFRGLAQHMGYGSYVAAAAEISVDGGKVKIHRIVAATDPGYAVNPAQIERQITGSFVYGLSALFYGECTVKDGHMEQTNFDSYNSMVIAEMPKVECIIMPTGGFWGGVGEPTICVAPPAVLNAVAAATGKRYRSVPLKNHGLSIA